MNNLLDFLQTHEEAFRRYMTFSRARSISHIPDSNFSRTRLASLYSDFRLQKSTNPDGYAANSSAWLRALTAASRAGLLPLSKTNNSQPSRLAFSSGNELAQSLQSPQWGQPLALGAVIQDAVEQRKLVPLQDFLSATKSVYSKSWVPSPWQVVSWGLRQIGIGGGPADKLAVGNFVVMANVEVAAEAVLRQVRQNNSTSLTSRIYSRELFESEFAHALSDPTMPDDPLSSNDVSILLTYLTRDKPALTYDSKAIKFAPMGTDPEPITEQDRTIANLRTLITSLQTQVESLTARIDQLDAKVRAAISGKQTVQAKTALRSKKAAENTLTARTATLAQLEQVFTSIEQAADQVAIVRVMEASGSVLRDLHKEVGGVEGVEGVVERLREEMENVDEVGRVIEEGSAGAVDEGEVEDELEEMERVEREKREAVEAEETRRRLAELEGEEAKRKVIDSERERERVEREKGQMDVDAVGEPGVDERKVAKEAA